MVSKILSEEGFTIHPVKNKLSGPRVRREVTGLVVNEKLGIGKKKFNYYRTKMFLLKKNQDPSFESICIGIIAYVKSVDKIKANKLIDYYKKLQGNTSKISLVI